LTTILNQQFSAHDTSKAAKGLAGIGEGRALDEDVRRFLLREGHLTEPRSDRETRL
jgi:hypothetical protein